MSLLDATHGKTKERVNGLHPLGVPTREVVVHCHDMNAVAGRASQTTVGTALERLAFARLHFGDLSIGEGKCTMELNIEHFEAEKTLG